MKIVIPNEPGAHKISRAEKWSSMIDQELLIGTLREALVRAAKQKTTILASFTQLVEWFDPIQAYTGARQSGLGECFFWEQPAEQNTLVGIGQATSIETDGITYFIDSATTWRALMKNAVITYAPTTKNNPGSGPIFFGGFAFDPTSPRTQLWSRFPGGLLILPRFLLSYSANQVTLTINWMVQTSDDFERSALEIEASVKQLQAAIELTPPLPKEQTTSPFSIHETRPASEWMELVANSIELIQQDAFEKVVLARDIQVVLDDPAEAIDISITLQRLRDSYPSAYVFAVQRGNCFFVGATPERLVQAQDGQIQTMALAGSAKRGETEEEDEKLGAELLQSEKNNNEHAIVVEMVQEALENHCIKVNVNAKPQLLKLKNLQHLKTPISGELVPGRCILDVMADLHPTPAVGGFPRHAALDAIRNLEKLDRGWYAGPLGWIGAGGYGEFAVALRSGLIDGSKATLFAGCGIVAHSDPQAELAESGLKFRVMLRGLGGEPLENMPEWLRSRKPGCE
jgi:isochorismate synthase